MNQLSPELEQTFCKVFKRTLAIDPAAGLVTRSDTERWDSLRHVELIFELEEAFGLDISPDDIVALYSDTDVIRAYLAARAQG